MQLPGARAPNPPSVESWHTGQEWIDGGALVRRVNFAAKFLGDASCLASGRSSTGSGRAAPCRQRRLWTAVSICSAPWR